MKRFKRGLLFLAVAAALGNLGMVPEKAALLGPSMFFIVLTIGRLVAGSIHVNPHLYFRVSALLGLAGAALVMTGNQVTVLIGIALAGLGFANIWPMLFSITIEEKPERASELSGLMCMAISGGALVPPVMGRLVDSGVATTTAFVVPAVCFIYLLLLSLRSGRSAASA